LELAAEMDHTAGSVDGLTSALTDLSFSQHVAALAQESLRSETGTYERDLPGHIETLKRLWKQEETLRLATEAITERITGKRAAQDAATVSTRGASEASKAAATAEREHVQALAEVERAMAAAQARAQSLAQQFGSLRDAIVQQQGQTTLDLLKLGVSPEDASREAAKGAAASMRLRTDQIVAAISKGTIGIEAGQRALNALRGGTPDPVLLALGLVPGLAAGGIVTRPTMALIGERGPEAIIPLGKASGFGGTTINVNVSGIVGDAAATGRAIADAINAASRQGGPVLLAGAVA
ncbi:MAG: hypothetical protein O3A25_19580, partial [Acidobacteria bacterium]|nr:hypothetical protein [Acidobacteriota bacterium]